MYEIRMRKLNLFIICVLLFSTKLHASMKVLEMNPPRFNKLMPVYGTCELDVVTKKLINHTGKLCTAALGQPGYYILVAEKNTLVRITINKKESPHSGFDYSPKGIIKNDLNEEVVFSHGTVTIINSGNSGDIHIYVGGEVVAQSRLSGATKYNVEFDIDFET